MKTLFPLIVYTANILGIFTDPFEFEGDYGPEINSIRHKVFELVVSREALSKNLTDNEIKDFLQNDNATLQEINHTRQHLISQAIEIDRQRGPTLSELATPELINELRNLQRTLQNPIFTENDIHRIENFLNHYGDQKIYRFLKNCPQELLSLDKTLRDNASREGRNFDLPLLSSTQILKGKNQEELKQDLLLSVFSENTFNLAKPESSLIKSLSKLDSDYLKQFFGDTADNQDLLAFCTPAGQAFFFWLYHALNLQLISDDHLLIDQVNEVKNFFVRTLADPKARAETLRNKLIEAGTGVLFTQESDTFVPQSLLADSLFLSIEKQNPKDGVFVFLRSDLWEPDYEIVSVDHYEGYEQGTLTLILATLQQSGEKFLLASGHGHSTKPEDGRLQISLVMKKFQQLSQIYSSLQLIIGIDANTKSEKDVADLREHLETLNLTATSVGPTTIKRRMVTAQNSKAGRLAIDEEDYLIVLKPEMGGRYRITKPTVGFHEEKPAIGVMLPNIENQSDHYPVGASLLKQP